ncbi:hypothetical protein V491_07239 [Pseudogymnoascus sp. VKM F-3775]|nr:hypothetical protein V491_07239 [Pseudogymnoascus sp. VKM F-3775]
MNPIRTSSILPWTVLDPLPRSPLEPKGPLSCYLPLQVRFSYTFPGIAEQEKRNKILCDLSSSQLLDITIPNLLLTLFETSTCIYASCGLSDINTFKSHGLNMLLKLSDARVARSTLTKERKISINDAQQKRWISEQDSLALASMLALVWVASMMFDYGDESAWGAGSRKDNSHGEPSAENNNLAKRQAYEAMIVQAINSADETWHATAGPGLIHTCSRAEHSRNRPAGQPKLRKHICGRELRVKETMKTKHDSDTSSHPFCQGYRANLTKGGRSRRRR